MQVDWTLSQRNMGRLCNVPKLPLKEYTFVDFLPNKWDPIWENVDGVIKYLPNKEMFNSF